MKSPRVDPTLQGECPQPSSPALGDALDVDLDGQGRGLPLPLVVALVNTFEDAQVSYGNCGVFAIALARVLGRERCEYALSSAEWDLDQPNFGHIGLRYAGCILDGRGEKTEDLLNAWAADENLNASVQFICATEDIDDWIMCGTFPSYDPEDLEGQLRERLQVLLKG